MMGEWLARRFTRFPLEKALQVPTGKSLGRGSEPVWTGRRKQDPAPAGSEISVVSLVAVTLKTELVWLVIMRLKTDLGKVSWRQ
jgi:hypothetical protein